MSDYQPIIDVQPLDHSREQATSTTRASSSRYSSAGTGPVPPFGAAYAQDSAAVAASKGGGSVLGGLARIVVGAGLVLVGIPMLILPGPGLLAMTAGALLMASGTRCLFG